MWIKEAMPVIIPSTRGQSITIIGAIRAQDGLIHYQFLEEGNNSKKFKEFINDLIKKLPKQSIVDMDNLPIHKTL